MGQSKTTIELNGKLYDATTGAIVEPDVAPQPTVAKPAAPSKNGVTMDGFFPAGGQASHTKTKPKAKSAHRATSPTAHVASHKPERAHTLMRHVVHKPKVTAPVASPVAKESSNTSKPITLAQQRMQRAATAVKSSSVSRFGSAPASTIDKKIAPLAVKAHPDAPKDVAPPISKLATPSAQSNSFEKALASASSHRQAPLKAQKLRQRTAKKLGVSSRLVSVVSGVLVVVLLAGFVAYQNVANISMRIAATRAGFNATLPGYTPGGFGMSGPIKTSPGAITVSFRSNSDNRSYEVTQKPSNWNSDSLRSNFFATNDSPTAYQDKGKTIYLYNNGSSATWVNGGILYQISGNAGLSSDQVVNIADSL